MKSKKNNKVENDRVINNLSFSGYKKKQNLRFK